MAYADWIIELGHGAGHDAHAASNVFL